MKKNPVIMGLWNIASYIAILLGCALHTKGVWTITELAVLAFFIVSGFILCAVYKLRLWSEIFITSAAFLLLFVHAVLAR